MDTKEISNIKYDIILDKQSFSVPLRTIIFNDVKKNSGKQIYKEKYTKLDHYSKILSDKQYFLISFKNLIFNEIRKRKYDIKNKDEFDDLISESYKILIELFDRIKESFETKYKDKPIVEKTKILQSFIRSSYPGRLFNWWCKWRNLKYIVNINGGKGNYKKMVFSGFNHQIQSEKDIEHQEDSEDKETNRHNKKYEYDIVDSSFDIEEFSIDKINLEILWKHIKLVLNEIQFDIFEMYYKKHMPYDKIMEALNISKQKATTTKFYADQRVKKYFKQCNIFKGDSVG